MRGVLSSIRGSQEVHIQNLFMGMQDHTRELQQGLAPPDGVRYLRLRLHANAKGWPILLSPLPSRGAPRYLNAEIFERDGWVCQLCDAPVDRSLNYPDTGSASLDHILPLSRGGHHVHANVQLAHLFCNLSKGARAA